MPPSSPPSPALPTTPPLGTDIHNLPHSPYPKTCDTLRNFSDSYNNHLEALTNRSQHQSTPCVDAATLAATDMSPGGTTQTPADTRATCAAEVHNETHTTVTNTPAATDTVGGHVPCDTDAEAATRLAAIRAALEARVAELFAAWCGGQGPPGSQRRRSKTLVQMNQEAVSYARAGDTLSAAAALTVLQRVSCTQHVTHRDLAVARCSLAGQLLGLGLAGEALAAAEGALAELEGRPVGLLDPPLRRALVTALLRRGQALSALGRPAAALTYLERGLQLEPRHEGLRAAADGAGRALAAARAAGRHTQLLALPAPEPRPLLALGAHSAASPALPDSDTDTAALTTLSLQEQDAGPAAVHWLELLPSRLLSGRGAEVEVRTRDTYNFVTIETDLRMPRRCRRTLHDDARTAAVCAAVRQAVGAAARGPHVSPDGGGGLSPSDDERDVRVLLLGSCAGLLGLVALRAGAVHVTCAERWLYLASAAGEVLAGAGVPPECWRVVVKRPGELRPREDVPVCCNVVVATELLDDGLLTSGLLPAVRHVFAAGLATRDAVVVPAAATVWLQAAELGAGGEVGEGWAPGSRTEGGGAADGGGVGGGAICSLNLRALDQYRWWPSQSLGAPLADGAYRALSQPMEAWHFDLQSSPNSTEARTLDLQMHVAGAFNAVVAWYDVRLYRDIRLITHSPPQPIAHRRRASQRRERREGLDGELVAAGDAEVVTHYAASNVVSPGERGDGGRVGAGGEHIEGSDTQEEEKKEEQEGEKDGEEGEEMGEEKEEETDGAKKEESEEDERDKKKEKEDKEDKAIALDGAEGATQPVRPKTLQAAVHWLPGPITVAAGDVLPLTVCHNTIALRYEVLSASYQWLLVRDPSLPPTLWTGLADVERRAVWKGAIRAAVNRIKAAGRPVVALDVGCGGGVLALTAAAAGADCVVGVEVHPTLVAAARRCAAENGLGHKVAVVQGDVGELVRGRDVPYEGANLIICDMFDAGLCGNRVLATLECVKRRLAAAPSPAAAGGGGEGEGEGGRLEVLPARARVWTMGIELVTRRVQGEDMSALNKYRWDDKYEAVRLQDLPYRQLTVPVPVFDFDFAQPAASTPGAAGYPIDARVKAKVIAKGVLNAVVFWYDLQLDHNHQLSNQPPGLITSPPLNSGAHAARGTIHHEPQRYDSGDAGNEYDDPQRYVRCCQALQYLDCALPVVPDLSSRTDACGDRTDGGDTGRTAQSGSSSTTYDSHGAGAGCSGHRSDGDKSVVMLVARRGPDGIRFGLRPGVGVPVPRPPYKVEWGGGVSVENPHVQRARYCQLLVAEWLQRLPRISRGWAATSGPSSSSSGLHSSSSSIAADLAPLWRSCGSLALDPVALAEVTHRLVLMERLYGRAGAGGAGLGEDGREVVAAAGSWGVGSGAGFCGGGAGLGEDGREVEGRVGLVRPEDVSLGLPAVWF